MLGLHEGADEPSAVGRLRARGRVHRFGELNFRLFRAVSDSDGDSERVIPLDHLIDDVMLYWLPNAGPSSARFYWEAANEMTGGTSRDPIPSPTGVSMFPGEQIPLVSSARLAAANIWGLAGTSDRPLRSARTSHRAIGARLGHRSFRRGSGRDRRSRSRLSVVPSGA